MRQDLNEYILPNPIINKPINPLHATRSGNRVLENVVARHVTNGGLSLHQTRARTMTRGTKEIRDNPSLGTIIVCSLLQTYS